MAGAETTGGAGFTPEELELLRIREQGLYDALQAGQVAAEGSARGWLNQQATTAVQLPLWPEPVRAVPNGALRSALFGAIRKGRRPYLEAEKLAAVAGIEVTYTGPRLDQGDLDAWEAILHALQGQDMGRECRTTSYNLLRLMGLKDTGGNRQLLKKRIYRLRANAVEIKQGRYEYIGGLLDRAARDEATQEWVIVLDPNLATLFAADQYTRLQWGVRRALAAKPLAQWLHGFFSSHAAPKPIKVETLHRLSGSEAGELKHFTQALKAALEALEKASAAAGQVFAWRIEGGVLHVTRTPSPSQKRHLERQEGSA